MTADDVVGVSLRMRDVGLALLIADGYQQGLQRIRLQKFIYLMDAVAVVFKTLPQKDGYVTYKHGPFDKKVQNAADALAFRGLVSIASLKSREVGGSISVEYRLTAAGKEWTQKLANTSLARERALVAAEVGKRISKLGWHLLVELVYAEPTFVSHRPDGFGAILETSDGLEGTSARLIQLIIRGLGHDGAEISREAVLDVYFRYLYAYSSAKTLGRVAR